MDGPVVCDVDEGEAGRPDIPPGVNAVRFVNSSGRPIDESELGAWLARQPARRGIQHIHVTYGSRLRSPWVVHHLPGVRTLLLEGRQLGHLGDLPAKRHFVRLTVDTAPAKKLDLSFLEQLDLGALDVRISSERQMDQVARCGALRNLTIRSWKDSDLQRLSSMRLDHLRLFGGRIQRARGLRFGRLISCHFGGCHHLASVAGIFPRQLTIDACNRLDLSTIGDNSRLEYLWLMCQRNIHSWSFMARCRQLRTFSSGACRFTAEDSSPISRARSLKAMYLGYAIDDVVRRMGAAHRKVTITNGRVCYSEGRPAPFEKYCEVDRKAEAGASKS